MNHIIEVLKPFCTPEIVGTLLTIILAMLLKSKIVTENDIAVAKDTIKNAVGDLEKAKSDVTDKTGLTLPQVHEIAKDVAVQVSGNDTNRKKVQRAARAVLRGWLKF